MDRGSREIVRGNGPVTTVRNIGSVLEILEANYGSRLYKDTDRTNVVALWSSRFAKDDPVEVLKAVLEYIDNESFPPTVADIKKIMKKNRKPEQHTIDDIVENANRLAAANGMRMTDDLREKNAKRVAMFLTPLTRIEVKIIQKREEKKDLRFVE